MAVSRSLDLIFDQLFFSADGWLGSINVLNTFVYLKPKNLQMAKHGRDNFGNPH